jgi:succinate-semialdehyde dehydrogenase/glutarate-semialdehyde dehydrogenase
MTQALQTHQLLINGAWRDGSTGDWLPVVNPATEAQIGRLAVATRQDLDDALAGAKAGFQAWRQVSAIERGKILRNAANNLRAQIDSLALALTQEQGKPLVEAKIELAVSADIFDWYAEEARRIYGRLIPARAPNVTQSVVQEPIGPVAAFSPWNFPASQAARKIAAAIAAGCSIIIKGPEETPSPIIALAQALLAAGLPAGVLNLVFGRPAEISEYLIPSPIIRKVSFTGSVPVGKHLAELAARHMKPATMELGGHSPVIVFDDADLDAATKQLTTFKYRNAGQVCISPTRFFVHQSIYDGFTEAFAAAAKAVKVGNGLEPETQMGPLANQRRVEAVDALISEAVADGARLVAGGRRIGNRGYFYEPTVLADIPAHSRILHQEPFGPVALLLPFESDAEAIAKANDTAYGLAAYAYTRSAVRADLVARSLEAGMISINQIGLGPIETPFGGIKDSGYGREGGSEGIEAYLQTKFVSSAAA